MFSLKKVDAHASMKPSAHTGRQEKSPESPTKISCRAPETIVNKIITSILGSSGTQRRSTPKLFTYNLDKMKLRSQHNTK